MINLSTFSYNQFNLKSLLCGYQLNQLKQEFEEFLTKLQQAGAHIDFVAKNTKIDDENFQSRRLQDYQIGCNIIDAIRENQNLDELTEKLKHINSFPYNVTILASLVQSAKKFGTVYCQNESSCNPAISQIQLVTSLNFDCLVGLDTYYFVFGRGLKIWSDGEFVMEKQKMLEIDTKVVQNYFKLSVEKLPIFATLATLTAASASPKNQNGGNELMKSLQKYFSFGSKNYYQNLTKFVKKIDTARPADEVASNIVKEIIKFEDPDTKFVEEISSLLASFDMKKELEKNIEFSNYGDDILSERPIFLSPVFLDLRCDDMKSVFELVKPLLVKTAGVLLQTSNAKVRIVTLSAHDGKFVEECLKPEVPQQKPFDFWSCVLGIPGYLQNDIAQEIPAEYLLDVYVLLYLLKNESMRLIEARIIMATLAGLRKTEAIKESDHPASVNERAYVYL